ncbi:MAG: ferritin family protein [Candidatus Marinimicrobia bacterium]|nr:ferritin family protein [Candidatus Neomarinimicrobiota bacterium]
MKTFNVKEIIEYAIKIEKESFEFYTLAAKNVKDKDVRELTGQLAGEEVGHQNRLRRLIDEKTVSPEVLLRDMEIDTTLMDRMVKTADISPDASPGEVLQVALERENTTEQTYAMLMTLSQITDDIVDIFRDLRLQEQGHANKIRARIAKLP